MNLAQKLEVLKDNNEWKCQKKRELLAEHSETWCFNGLNNLKPVDDMIIGRRELNDVCSLVTVEIGLNDHWSDKEVDLNFRNV